MQRGSDSKSIHQSPAGRWPKDSFVIANRHANVNKILLYDNDSGNGYGYGMVSASSAAAAAATATVGTVSQCKASTSSIGGNYDHGAATSHQCFRRHKQTKERVHNSITVTSQVSDYQDQ